MQLSVKQVATFLNVPEKMIYRWIEQKVIPAYQINEQIRFNRSELFEWATSRGISVSPALFEENEEESLLLPSLSEALHVGGIAYHIGGMDQASVLREVVQYLSLPNEVDREFLYQVLLARETLGTTAIGDGIAIPHVRNPVILHVLKPSVTLCFLENAIDFHALDGKPVHTLFTLISPAIRTHLHLLSRLSYTLNHAECRALLQRRAAPNEILAAISKLEESIPVKGR